MQFSEHISSPQNKKVLNVIRLQHKAGERRQQGLFVIEGIKELTLALEGGINFSEVFVCPDIEESGSFLNHFCRRFPDIPVYSVSRGVYARMAYRDDSGGVVALAKPFRLHPHDIMLPAKPLVVVLEKVEKPGNLGAVLRTADAAGVDLVMVCDPDTDIYNPNVIRSGLGCVFTKPVLSCSSEEAIGWLKSRGIKIYAAALQNASAYHLTDFTAACALVFGTEASGLTEKWRDAADKIVKIPMHGKIDSLNVSNSVAVMVYEALRQRGDSGNQC